MLVETFSGHCISGLYIINYQLRNHIVELLRSFCMLLVLESNLYDQLNMHIKLAYRGASQRRTSQILGTVYVMDKGYESVFTVGKEYFRGNLVRRYKRVENN